MMDIKVHRNETSQPMTYKDVLNAYTKGNMYCILFINKDLLKTVHKYPLCSIFRIEESY